MSMPRRPGFFQDKDGPGITLLLVVLVVVAVVGAKYFGFTPGKKAAPEAQGEPQAQVPTDAPLVLVYAAHPTENYSPSPAHAKGMGDIVTVAKSLKGALQSQKLNAQLLELPVTPWNEAYEFARNVLLPVVNEAKGLAAILDVHRDALEAQPDGYTTVMVGQTPVAKVLLVVGDVENPYIEQNLAFAESIRTELETLAPGICRGVKVLHEKVNGDIHPQSTQIYIGDYTDNTTAEAQAAVTYVAQAVQQVVQR